MDYRLTEEEVALKKEFDDFFIEEMKNAPPEYAGGGIEGMYATDEGFAFHKNMAKKLGDKGWLSMGWPEEYGGKNASIMEQALFNESRGYHNAPGVDVFAVSMFAQTLLAGASEDQKQRLLPPIANGEAFYCQGWSEPDAGSDLASLTTTAIKDGDHYVVNGQKSWTTGGHKAEFMFLLARTDADSKRSKGLSFFHLRMDLPGIEIRPVRYMDGKHLYNEVFFKDVKIPASDLIGQEGGGWDLTRHTMNHERSNLGTYSEVKQILEKIVEYVKTTKRDGKYLSENPVVRQKLAKLFIRCETGIAFGYKIAWYQQKNDIMNVIPAASGAKLHGSELLVSLAAYATEIMGPHSLLEECEWAPISGMMPELYQFSKAGTIFAGSSEVQRNLIAWVGLGLPRMKLV